MERPLDAVTHFPRHGDTGRQVVKKAFGKLTFGQGIECVQVGVVNDFVEW